MCAATITVTTKQTSHQKPARTGTATAGHIRIHKTATRWEGGEIAFHLGSRQQQRAQTHSAPPPNQPKPPRAASSLPLAVPTPARVQTPESPHLTRCDARPPPARAPSSHALQQGSSSPSLPPSPMAAPATVPLRQLFVDGEWRAPAQGRRLPVINPATEAQIGEIPAGTAEDVDAAVAAARAALRRNRGRDWARAPGAVRAKYLRAIAAKVLALFTHDAVPCCAPGYSGADSRRGIRGFFFFML